MSAEKSKILNLFAQYAGRGRDYGVLQELLKKLDTVKADCDTCDTRESDVKKAYDEGFKAGVSSVKVEVAKPAPKAKPKAKPKTRRKSTPKTDSKDVQDD